MSFGTGLLYDILSDIMRSIVDHIGFLISDIYSYAVEINNTAQVSAACTYTMLLGAALCTLAVGLYQILSLNEDVKQISRKYMLTMETMGYLDAASRTSLMQDLSDLQVTDIDLTGSTMTDAGYGNAVYLQITCKLPIEQLNMDGNDMLRFFFEDGTIPIRVRRMSTAKN